MSLRAQLVEAIARAFGEEMFSMHGKISSCDHYPEAEAILDAALDALGDRHKEWWEAAQQPPYTFAPGEAYVNPGLLLAALREKSERSCG